MAPRSLQGSPTGHYLPPRITPRGLQSAPEAPKKTPEEEENLPWLLRDSNSTKKKCRIERALEDAYDKNPFPTIEELSELEEVTNMSTKKIIYWFQQTRKTKLET